MAKRGSEICTVRGAPVVSRTGDKTQGAVVGVLAACIVWPRTSDETADRGTIIIDGYTVWAPAPVAVNVLATHTITCRGTDWNIDGVPGDWRNKRGQKLGIMVMLKRTGT